MVTIGLDPHPDSHSVAALDENRTVLTSLEVVNDAEGLLKLDQFALPFPNHRWAVEGAANRFILPFVRELLEHGEVVRHIPPNLTSQYRARLSLNWEDIDLSEGTPKVGSGKAGKIASVNPSSTLVHELERIPLGQRQGYLLPARSRIAVYKRLEAVAEQ